jgi:hypothetical protein
MQVRHIEGGTSRKCCPPRLTAATIFTGETDLQAVCNFEQGQAAVVAVSRDVINGVSAEISTSYVERSNLSVHMGCRRFTRLTNGFSKKTKTLAPQVKRNPCTRLWRGLRSQRSSGAELRSSKSCYRQCALRRSDGGETMSALSSPSDGEPSGLRFHA